MAAKKSTPSSRAKSRVASRAKGAARASASKTSAKQERAVVRRSLEKPGKIKESGVTTYAALRALQQAAKGATRSSTKPKPSQDPMRNKNAPRKTNRQMYDEYYKNWKGPRPDPR